MGGNGTVAKDYYKGAAAAAMEVSSAEHGHTAASKCYDDDGRLKRTGKELKLATLVWNSGYAKRGRLR
jgi:hypothetical protein